MRNDGAISLVVVPLTDLVVDQGESVVLISHSSGLCRAVTVNQSGFQIWRLIDGQRRVEEIISLGLETWSDLQCSARQVQKDILEFLDALASQGCIQLVSSTCDDMGDKT